MTSNAHLQKLSPILEELRQTVQAAEQPTVEEALRSTLQVLNRQILMPPVAESFIWVWLYGNPTPSEWAQITRYFDGYNIVLSPDANTDYDLPNASGQLRWRINWTSTESDALATGQNTAGLFFVTQDACSNTPAVLDHLALCSACLPVMTVVSGLDWSGHFEARQRLRAALVRTETWQQANAHTLLQDIAVLNDTRALEVLQAVNVSENLERGATLAQQLMQQTEFNLKVKRQQAQQEETAHRSRSSSSPGAGSGSELRNRLLLRLEQHERRQLEENEAVLSGNTNGACFKNLDIALEQMPPLAEEKRAKNIAYIIPETFKQAWIGYLAQMLRQYATESNARARDFIGAIDETTKQYLADHNLALTLPPPVLTDLARSDEMIAQALRFERNYEATAVKKKNMEILSGMRMYVMMFMMVATMFGIGQILRQESFKMYFIPTTVLLAGLGAWTFFSNKDKEESENREKFGAAAKDSLRSEAKRMLQEFSRTWERTNFTPLREWVQTILREAENTGQKSEQQFREVRDAETNRTKIILEGLKSQESAVQSALRNKASFDRNLSRARADLQNLLRSQLVKYRAAHNTITPTATDRELRRTIV
jgi:hypothetical protein